MNKRILLIGRNPQVLANLAAALTDEGYVVTTTSRVEQASQEFTAGNFDGIAFGRGIDEQTNAQLRTDFARQHKSIVFIDGLAPVIPLLVKQIRLALLNEASYEKVLTDFSVELAGQFTVNVTVLADCQLVITLYQLDAVHKTQADVLVSAWITTGAHCFPLNLPLQNSTIRFLAAEVNDQELSVFPL